MRLSSTNTSAAICVTSKVNKAQGKHFKVMLSKQTAYSSRFEYKIHFTKLFDTFKSVRATMRVIGY